MPAAARKYPARARREVAGGIAVNSALAAARLGGRVRLVSRVGDDMAGRSLRQTLEEAGVDCAGLTVSTQGGTSTSAVLIDAAGERMLVNYKDPALFAGAPDPALFAGADAILCDLRWPEASRAGLKAASALAVPGILDYDLAPEAGEALIPLATHVIFAEEALLGLCRAADAPAALASLAAMHPGIAFAATAGGRGVYWRCGGDSGHLPGLKVRAVDTLGAGDVFHAAAALALGEGRPFAEALAFGNTAAGIKVSRPGGMNSFPTRSETERMMESLG